MDDGEEVIVQAEYRVTREMRVQLKPGKTLDDANDPSSWENILMEDDVESRLLDVLGSEEVGDAK